MKSPALLRHIIAAALLLPAVAGAQSVTSAVPGFISYQGRVLNSSGGLVGAGTPVSRTVIFRVWDHPSNTLVANLLYSEAQTVTVSEGEFSVLVGTGSANPTQTFGYSESTKGPPATSLANVFNGSTRYLGVTVAAGAVIATTDNEITPRQQVVSSAFALRAKFAESLGSNGATAITAVDGGNVGIGNTNPPALFTVTGSNTGTSSNAPQLAITDSADANERLLLGMDSTGNGTGFIQATKVGTGAQNLLINPNGGNVGIGMGTAPTAKLDVTGSIKATGAGGYTFNTGDLDGGLFSPVDGAITLNTNGAERVRVDGSGNVGIGFNSPAAKLDVRGPGASSLLRLQPTSDNWFVSEMVDFAGTQRFYTGIAKNSSDFVWGTGLGDAAMGVSGAKKLFISAIGVAGQPVESVGIVMHGNNVGIGTTSPASKLSVNCTTNQVGENNASFASPNIGTGVCFIHYGTLGDVYFRSANTSTGKVIIQDQGGNVGVGTTSPTQAKLVVNGSVSNQPHSTASNFILNTGQTPNTVVTAQNNSIYTSTTIWSGGWVVVSSDGRIKTITGISNSQRDLDMLRGIEITDYFYKDKITKGGAAQKKVIAQQVEKVFPQAVSKQTDVVPDIFQTGDFKDGWVTLKTDLKKGERVRLTDDKTTDVFEVLEVVEGKFRTAFKPEGDKVFVYGREVKDFRTVDYEAISMLNVSATQELARKVESLEKANAEKDSALTAMTKRLAALEAKDKARDAKLAAIEKVLLSGEKAPVRTASLKSE